MATPVATMRVPREKNSSTFEHRMDKTYDPLTIEQAWYETWEKNGYFEPSGQGEPYCIMIPPPNVTGSLHMGHAFQDTIMDALIRYHRMKGDNTLWQAGMDHAGIATQIVVERQLNGEGLTRHDIGREAFLRRVWEWKEHSGGTISRQLRRMGASVDWATERFTMDEGLSEAVRETFVRLYDEGLIYRGKRLVNWDPVLHTAVSDLEVISEEEDGFLWHIRYPVSGGVSDADEYVVVATTRPETMLGDTAVAVHPDDKRYRHLLGQTVDLPLTGRRIPVIADDYVDPEFGSGALKITPAHDFNDYVVGERHGLEMINVLTVDARTNDNAPPRYRDLDRFEARERVVADLQEQGLLEKIEAHRLKIPRGDRSNSVIEPFLTDQWFVKAAPLAAPAIKAVEDGRIRFVPENWSKTYFEWMRNIEDWCISRQLWWGHRIPAWYDANGNIYVGRSEEEVREKHGLDAALALEQDPDVLDTWFSSALWPFSTIGWPRQTERLKVFYPGSVLVTGFDIIFFWVARMIMMGLKFMDEVPFTEVYIHGLVRDADGNKMSKSKGNILDPLDLADGIDLESLVKKRTTGLMRPDMAASIEADTRRQYSDGIPAFGTDALRFTFCSLATTGRDIRFDLGRIEGYRNYCNKLWNAARFVVHHTEGEDCGYGGGDMHLGLAERWIISLLQMTENNVRDAIEQYRFDHAAQLIYEFTWDEYCPWYLEFAKPVLSDSASDPAALRGTRHTLVAVLEALLRLAHPLIPFITEAIWQRIAPIAGRNGPTIMREPYPVGDSERIDQASLRDIDWLKGFILAVRRVRGEQNIQPGRRVPILLENASQRDRDMLTSCRSYLDALAGLESVAILEPGELAPKSAAGLLGDMKILIPLAGLIDTEAESARLAREIEKHEKDLSRSEQKLGNSSFVDRAPPEIVAKERTRAEELRAAISNLKEQHASLESL
jgi:valyl-tRNA synthetase